MAATPDERATSVAETARLRFQNLFQNDKLTVAEVDRFREWAGAHAPERVDALTGSALATMFGNGLDPTIKAAELALHYQESSGKDDVLAALLRGPFSGDHDRARELAGKIKDPEIRADILRRYEPQPSQ
ncbi:MAG: hypothetical protein EOP85_19005 [Verrucomicrobiaceae bacterium]|nr:MAG: hypothetical protein EOP85_19005 [Verrucomicrobiaceae bacterium]